MSWELRRAGVADLDAIMALEEASFENDAWSRESMRRELASAQCYYLVGVDAEGTNAGIAGYAGLLCPAGAADADIQTIAVAEEARGRGLGRQLMQRLLAEAGARRAKTVFLEVRADNPVAQALYVSLGFAEIAVRPNYYQPDGVNAIVMRAEVPLPGPALATPGAPGDAADATATGVASPLAGAEGASARPTEGSAP